MSTSRGNNPMSPGTRAILRTATGLGEAATIKAACPSFLMLETRARKVPEKQRVDYYTSGQRLWRMASRASDRRIGKLFADRFEERRLGAALSEADRDILLTWPPHELRALASRLRSLYDDVLHPKRELLWLETMFSPRRRPASRPRLLEMRSVTVTNTFGQLGVIADIRLHAPWSKAAFV